jgi:hypothetical protein
MTKQQATKIARELESIRSADPDGVLRPEDVVEFARDPKSELHRQFEWNDSEAAAAYRLTQARQIIRVRVTMLDTGDGEETVRAYVSLYPPSRGYEETADTLSTKRGRRDLILKLLDRMLNIAQSYALPELRPVVRAIAQMQSQIAAKPRGRPTTRRSSSRDKDSRISP